VTSKGGSPVGEVILSSEYRTSPVSILLKLENIKEPIKVFYCESGVFEDINSTDNYEVGATGSYILHP
jgi:hypothetical protein